MLEFLDSTDKRNPTTSKLFWNNINKMNNKTNNKQTIPTLIQNNNKYSSNKEKAELFGEILEKNFKNYDENEFDANNYKEVNDQINNLKDTAFKSNINFKEFNFKEFETELKRMKKKSAPGFDKIHNMMLINSSIEFKKIILYQQ